MRRTLVSFLVVVAVLGFAVVGYGQEEKVVLKYMTWVNALGAEWIQEDFIEPFQELSHISKSNTNMFPLLNIGES